MDMISKLPACIIENILCLLPIQEAARTSILAKEWRYRWTKIPKLVFEEHTFPTPTYGDELSDLEDTYDNIQSGPKVMTRRCKFFYAINQVLSKHDGPIHEFILTMELNESHAKCDEIDPIMSYLSSTSNVKKLTLNMAWGYRLPLSFLLFDQLTDLYLHMCDLDYPPTVNGFCHLTSLCMDLVTITKSALLHLLSNCPSLKSLTMFSDDIQDIGDSTVANLFESFPMVEDLSIWLSTIKNFARSGVPRVLPAPLIHLKCLYIGNVNFKYKDWLQILCCLIRSSPNLEKLQLQIFKDPWFIESGERSSSSTLDYHSDIWLEHLSILEISNMSKEKLELDFVTFILAKSPVLKKVKIYIWDYNREDDESDILEALSSSQRASPMAEIIVKKLLKKDFYNFGFKISNCLKRRDVWCHWPCFVLLS